MTRLAQRTSWTRSSRGAPRGGGNPHGPASTSLTATQADQALLEAAMSSAVHHPNVVQTYHYRTVQPSKLASGDAISRAVRVRPSDCPAAISAGETHTTCLDSVQCRALHISDGSIASPQQGFHSFQYPPSCLRVCYMLC